MWTGSYLVNHYWTACFLQKRNRRGEATCGCQKFKATWLWCDESNTIEAPSCPKEQVRLPNLSEVSWTIFRLEIGPTASRREGMEAARHPSQRTYLNWFELFNAQREAKVGFNMKTKELTASPSDGSNINHLIQDKWDCRVDQPRDHLIVLAW